MDIQALGIRLTCTIPDGWACEVGVTEIEAGLAEVRIALRRADPAPLQGLRLQWMLPAVGAFSRWLPGEDFRRGLPVWGESRQDSALSLWAPVACLHGTDGLNALTFAWSDAVQPTRVTVRVEENAPAQDCRVEVFPDVPSQPRVAYAATLRLDRRAVPYWHALRAVAAWWEDAYPPLPAPPAAMEPLYSTWYACHQAVDAQGIERQCALARTYGIGALIVDDGWQTPGDREGYRYAGDWEPVTEKFPEMAAHVARVQAQGIAYLLWIALPFIGCHTQAWARFGAQTLNPAAPDVRTLDPRYAEVRAFMVERCVHLVRDLGLAGLKIDFIDNFLWLHHRETMPPANASMDVPELADAVTCLLDACVDALRQVRPDVLVELRQRYMGPGMRPYGNMLRALDCPHDPLANRLRVIDLRLLAGDTPVHSDMIIWHRDERPEHAALHLYNALFAVPQISVRLDELPHEHQEVLRVYLDFWRTYRDVLMAGELAPEHSELLYPLVRASTSTTEVIALYAAAPVLTIHKPNTAIVNAAEAQPLWLAPDAGCVGCSWQLRDCRGQIRATGRLEARPTRIEAPVCGVIRVPHPAG